MQGDINVLLCFIGSTSVASFGHMVNEITEDDFNTSDIGFLILPHGSLYLVQFCLAIFRRPVILISVTVVKHGRTMIHLEKYLGLHLSSRNAPPDSDLSPPPFLGPTHKCAQ